MRKVRDRILATLLIVGVLSALPIAVIGVNTILRSSREQAQSFGEKSADYNAQIISTWLNEKMKLLLSLKQQLYALSGEDPVQDYLRMYAKTSPDIISIFIGFDDNRMIDAYDWAPPPEYRVTERPWYSVAKGRENAVTSVYLDQNKQDYVIAIATDLNFRHNEGVLAANIYADYVKGILDEIRFGDTGFAMLLDDRNQLICPNSDPGKIALFRSLLGELEGRYGAERSGSTYEVRLDGVSYLTTVADVKGYGWKLFLIAPISDFTKSARTMVTQFIFVISFLLIIIILLDYFISRSISQPIDRLIHIISSLAGGFFDIEIRPTSQDELGQLTTALDKMRSNLKSIFESMEYEGTLIAMNSQALAARLSETYRGTHRFMSMLSHDIKTPVTLIKGYATALDAGIVSEEKAQEVTRKILYRVDQIEMIVKDVLDSTYELNNLRVNRQQVSCRDFLGILRYNAEGWVADQARTLEISCALDDMPENAGVAVDIVKLQRVMNNLLSNAMKFSKEDTVITLYFGYADRRLLICVRDRGPGIRDEDKERIFNMFYKADESKAGYGLGLYISQAILDAHGSQRYLKTDQGEGCAIGFYIDVMEMS